MDDVWVVIGLLLFGSLLFCLCCYKVSNLLYMLYHIDDDPDSAQNHLGGTGDLTAVGVASVANAAAAAVIASATSGNSRKGSIKIATAKTDESPTNPLPERIHPGQMPPTAGSKASFVYVNELEDDRIDNPNNTQAPSKSGCPKDFSEKNHITNSKSNMSLRQQQIVATFDSNKSKSVTSLSVGVQCNPSDVLNVMNQLNRSSSGDVIKANSRTALIGYEDNDDDDENDGSISSNNPQGHNHRNCKHHQNSRKSYARPLRRIHPKHHLQGFGANKNLHFSNPDFRLSSYQDDDDEDDDFIPLVQSQYYFNPNKQKLDKTISNPYQSELNQRKASEEYEKGSFYRKETNTVIRCPSNHSLVKVTELDENDPGRGKENSPRHCHPEQQCEDEMDLTSSSSFRNSARRYSHKQVQSHQRPSDPYPHNTKSSGTQSGMGTYRLVVKRRGSTPSPNRLNPGVSSTSLLSNDVYEDFHTNSLGRGQSKNVCKDHFNDLALHRSISPLLSSRPSILSHERGDSQQEINWPTSPITDGTIDMLNRPETFYNTHQGNIAPSPSTQLRSRIVQPSHNQHSSLMSQNLRLSSNPKLSHETSTAHFPSRVGFAISPPPMPDRDYRRRRSARRYGSIRVEECSFVEQDGSPLQPQPSQSTTNYAYESDLPPLKRVYIDKASIVPKSIKEPYSSSKRKCNNPQHDHSVISHTDLGKRNCHRHNSEMYIQSNPAAASRNYSPFYYQNACDLEPAFSSEINRASSSDKFSSVFAASSAEDNFPSHQSKSHSHAQQRSVAAGVRRYRDLEHPHSSQFYEKRNEISSHPCQHPSYPSSSFINQSRDRHQPSHALLYSSNLKEQDARVTEPALTLDLIQHANLQNTVQHRNRPLHYTSFESMRNQDRNFDTLNVSPKKIILDPKYSPRRTIALQNKSNRSSTGSNIIPPPHDFESDMEKDEILCIEPSSSVGDVYSQNEAKKQKCKDRNSATNTKNKDTRAEKVVQPNTRVETYNVFQRKPSSTNHIIDRWDLGNSKLNSKHWNHDSGADVEMIELQTTQNSPRRNSPSFRESVPSKKNSQGEENFLTDSETISTLTSLSNDVTVIDNVSPTKSETLSDTDSNSTKQQCVQHIDGEAAKPQENALLFCDKGQSIVDKQMHSQKLALSPKTLTLSLPVDSKNSTNLATTVATSTGKIRALTNSIQPTANGEKQQQKDERPE